MFRHLAVLALTITVTAATCGAQAPAGSSQVSEAHTQAVDLKAIVQHIDEAAKANREHYRPYSVTRQYFLFGSDQQKPNSEVLAEINFVPPGTKDYKILESKGSSRGEGIVRHLLDTERKSAADHDARGSVTSDHYNFAYAGEELLDKHDCYVLRLTPKQDDKSLFKGKAWVDKTTYLVRKVEGDMSKLPSWWLKSVHVTLLFQAVDGMWMQSSTRAVADVRIVGLHTFVSDLVNYRSGDTVATNRSPRPRKKNTAVLGVGMIREP